MLSVEETRALSVVNAELEELMKTTKVPLGGWTMDTDPQTLRALIAQMRKVQLAAKPDPATMPFVEEDIQIPVRDGTLIAARVHKPRDLPESGCPGVVIFHGGGFIVGDLETEAPLCQLFTSLGGIAVNVKYRHAPEHPFPTPVNDCYDALVWTAKNVESMGINPTKGFILGGESSGADISLSIAHLYRVEKTSPPLTGLYATLTSGVSAETVPEKYKDHFFSMEQNSSAPFFTSESLQFVRHHYKPNLKSPLAFAVAYPDHSGLPKTYFQACGFDPVRDCTLVMEQVWRDAGIPTKLDVYPGLPHGFWAMYPEAEFSKKHHEDSKKGLRWLLEP